MTDLERAEELIKEAKRELEAINTGTPERLDSEAFEKVFEMLRELARAHDEALGFGEVEK